MPLSPSPYTDHVLSPQGWICILVLNECIAVSLGELASRYPTSGGPSYWSFQVAPKYKTAAAFITGWVWLIGNWTITLRYGSSALAAIIVNLITGCSVNFGFASLLSSTISMYHGNFVMNSWQLLLVFYAVCILSFAICTFCNRWLPQVDTVCAAWTAISIVIILIALSVKADAGRHSASFSLSNYDTSFSGVYHRRHTAFRNKLILNSYLQAGAASHSSLVSCPPRTRFRRSA